MMVSIERGTSWRRARTTPGQLLAPPPRKPQGFWFTVKWSLHRAAGRVRSVLRLPASRQVFLSHSGDDAQLVRRIGNTIQMGLRDRGLYVDVFNTSEGKFRFREKRLPFTNDQQEIEAERKLHERALRRYLEAGVRKSDVFVALVTQRHGDYGAPYKGSEYTKLEMTLARDRQFQNRSRIFFLTLLISNVDTSIMPDEAGRFHYMHYKEGSSDEKLLSVLAAILTTGDHRAMMDVGIRRRRS